MLSNTNGRIFGGYLMSRAYELARCTAYLFCGRDSRPYFVAVDQISFLRPVEIGSLISFRCKVAYAAGWPDRAFQLRVETLIHDLKQGTVFPSNVFEFTFRSDHKPIRKVVPNTYRGPTARTLAHWSRSMHVRGCMESHQWLAPALCRGH